MKQKTHSGLKKRIRVRKNGKGAVMTEKSGKRHLLRNKSKKMKKSFTSGYPVTETRMKAIRKLMPGKIKIRGMARKVEETAEAK